jgi:hypothetical protein
MLWQGRQDQQDVVFGLAIILFILFILSKNLWSLCFLSDQTGRPGGKQPRCFLLTSDL